jgi:hypothetical protein
MAGMISVRVTHAERKKLMELKAQRGCENMSQVIRLMLGFPRSVGDEILDGADDIDGVSSMIRVVLRLIDRVETSNATVYKLAKQSGLKEVRHRPLEVLATPVSADEPVPYRGGHEHPALPEGFQRA